MALIGIKMLAFAQIGIDIIIGGFLILLVRRLRGINEGKKILNQTKVFESLIADADKMAEEFKEQLEEKHNLIRRFSKDLDKRIANLNLLLNRANTLLSSHDNAGNEVDGRLAIKGRRTKIIKLASKGYKVQEIADTLSIPREEVRLILDLTNKSPK